MTTTAPIHPIQFAVLGLFIAMFAGLPTMGCTKAENKPERDNAASTTERIAPEASRTKRPAPTKPPVTVPRIGLSAHSPARDRISVLLRIDRLAELALDKSADAIMAPLPDYQRVYGDGSQTLVDRFDIVMISTSDPTRLIATTLAARLSSENVKIRDLLTYNGAGVTWRTVDGKSVGSFSTTERFAIDDPRLYFLPGKRWIVLAKPEQLGSLASELPDAPKPAPWLDRLPTAPDLGGPKRNVLAVFEARDLQESVSVQGLGMFQLPTHMGVVLDGTRQDLVLSGWLRFVRESDAEKLVTAVEVFKQLVDGEELAATLRQHGALRPLQTLEMSRAGTGVTWRASVRPADVRAMARYSASLARQWMTGMGMYHPR